MMQVETQIFGLNPGGIFSAMQFTGDFTSYEEIRNAYGNYSYGISFVTSIGPSSGILEIQTNRGTFKAATSDWIVRLSNTLFVCHAIDLADIFTFGTQGTVAQQGTVIPQAIPIQTPPDFFNSEPTTAPAPAETAAQRMGRIMKDVAGGR